MTPNAIFAAVAVGLFVLSCVVSWHLVLVLRQTRATALALEQFLNGTRPRIEAAAEQLSGLIQRTDRILTAAEGGQGTPGFVMRIVGQVLTGWSAGAQAISTISALIAGIVQAWSALSKPQEEVAPAATGGTSHD